MYGIIKRDGFEEKDRDVNFEFPVPIVIVDNLEYINEGGEMFGNKFKASECTMIKNKDVVPSKMMKMW